MNKRFTLTLLLAMSILGLYTPRIVSMEQNEAEFKEELKKKGFDESKINEILTTIKETEKEIGEDIKKSSELTEKLVNAEIENKALNNAADNLEAEIEKLTSIEGKDTEIEAAIKSFGQIMQTLITNKKLSTKIGSTKDDTAAELFRKYVNTLVAIKNDTKNKKEQVAKFKELLLSSDELKAIQ